MSAPTWEQLEEKIGKLQEKIDFERDNNNNKEKIDDWKEDIQALRDQQKLLISNFYFYFIYILFYFIHLF